VLLERNIAAFTTEQHGTGQIGAKDIAEALRANDVGCPCGLVIVKASNKRYLEVVGNGLVEVDVDGELELDHVLSLLSVADIKTR
jgi:dihydroxyacetone kinase